MANIPDFTMKQSFPIASVIDAMQRKAQIEQQAKLNSQTQLLQGFKDIGTVGQSLVDKRLKVAQALALGKQFGIDENQARLMEPDQILKVAATNKGMIDANFLQSAFLALSGRVPTPPPAAPATPASGTVPPAAPASNGVVLAGGIPTAAQTPAPAQAPDPSLSQAPPAGNVPVPIQAPPVQPKMVNPATARLALDVAKAGAVEPVLTRAEAEAAGGVKHGTHILPDDKSGATDQKEQDGYWREGVRGLQSIRGDTAMKDIETQRNAAIQAYNRLRDIEMTGKAPNPIDYIDILGQVYKARTGTAPVQEVLKEAKQATAVGQLGKYWTYFTGEQMPGTSAEIAGSLKNMVAHMGLQSDDLHDGYMQVHGALVFNPNMSEANVKKLSKLSRGKSFTEATGVKPEDFDVHLQAIKWAKDNPNDPRSAPILQKALQEKSASGGGSIGL